MDQRASKIRHRLHFLIILILISFIMGSIKAQRLTPWPTVYDCGKCVGNLYDIAINDISEDNLYMVDSIHILFQNIALYIPVFLRASGEEVIYAPLWIAQTKNETKQTASIDFISSISGDVCRLRIKKKNHSLYIVEEMTFWMNSSYNYYLSEENIISLSAIQIRHKKNIKLIEGNIAFNDYFDVESGGFDIYYCPQKYSLEECIKLVRCGHQFKIQDFEDE